MHWMPFLLHQKSREIIENLFVLSWEKLLTVTPDRMNTVHKGTQLPSISHASGLSTVNLSKTTSEGRKSPFGATKCVSQFNTDVSINGRNYERLPSAVILSYQTGSQCFWPGTSPSDHHVVRILHMLSSGCLFCTVIAHCLNKTHSICNCTCEIMQHFILITRILVFL